MRVDVDVGEWVHACVMGVHVGTCVHVYGCACTYKKTIDRHSRAHITHIQVRPYSYTHTRGVQLGWIPDLLAHLGQLRRTASVCVCACERVTLAQFIAFTFMMTLR